MYKNCKLILTNYYYKSITNTLALQINKKHVRTLLVRNTTDLLRIDPVRPISAQNTSSDDSVEITNVLQEIEGDDEAQEVKPSMRVSIAEKQIKRMILVLNVNCFHVFFLGTKLFFWDSFLS